MAKGAIIFNLMARRYSRQPIANQQAYEHKLKLTRKYLTPESEVLEVGCGTGSTAILHAPYVKQILATDYAYKMIEIANEKKAAENLQNVQFKVEEIEKLKPDPGKYDVVLALNILHIVEDKPSALRKFIGSLKPGGYFISSTPCIENISGIWLVMLWLFRLLGFPNLETMNVEKLKTLVREAGFQIEEEWIPEGDIKSLFLVASRPRIDGDT